ncbi:MAG: hypothetical protein WCL10_15625 [Novosphingobium sp.]|uniref:hypothetical protein n=1 Tax=Novosphingobium sp. TaxID=1874826 RepID=UPI003019E54B
MAEPVKGFFEKFPTFIGAITTLISATASLIIAYNQLHADKSASAQISTEPTPKSVSSLECQYEKILNLPRKIRQLTLIL